MPELLHLDDEIDDKTMNSYIANEVGRSGGRLKYTDIEYDHSLYTYNPHGFAPELKPIKITIGDRTTQGHAVLTQKADEGRPFRFVSNKRLLEARLNAYSNYIFWSGNVWTSLQALSRSLHASRQDKIDDTTSRVLGMTLKRNMSLVFSDMNHLYNSLRTVGFPRDTRKILEAAVDKYTRELIGHLRNIHEHSTTTRPYFEGSLEIMKQNRNTKSVAWFRDKYPHANPWRILIKDDDVYLAEAIPIESIKSELSTISTIIKANTREHVVIHTIKARY